MYMKKEESVEYSPALLFFVTHHVFIGAHETVIIDDA